MMPQVREEDFRDELICLSSLSLQGRVHSGDIYILAKSVNK